MERFAELLAALASAPHGEARGVWLRAYFADAGADRGWAAGWLLGALPAPRLTPAKLRKAAEARVDPELLRISAKAIGDVGETVGLIWPGGGDMPLSAVAEGLEAPEALLDGLEAEGRVALIRLLTGRKPRGVRFAEIRDALTALSGHDAGTIGAALAAGGPPYAALFAWLDGAGPKPQVAAPRPPVARVEARTPPPPGASAWPLPPGQPVALAEGRAFGEDGAPVAAGIAGAGWGFLLDGRVSPPPEGAPLNAPSPDLALLIRTADGAWLIRPAARRALICPVGFVELGPAPVLSLTVSIGEASAPLVKLPAAREEAAAVFAYVRKATEQKFGPVRQIAPGLSAEVSFAGTTPARRRKTGLELVEPRLERLIWEAAPAPDLSDVTG